MKKWLVILGMLTSLLGMNVHAMGMDDITSMVDENSAAEIAGQLVNEINEIVLMDQQDYVSAADPQLKPILDEMFNSWISTIAEIGEFQEITGHRDFSIDADGMRIVLEIKGSEWTGTVDVALDGGLQIERIIAEPDRAPMSVLMKNAGLNTLLGMGTVFVMLILISLIISCFKYLPGSGAKPAQKDDENNVVDKAIAQIEKNEELSDDAELVAVIAAAIAASEGTSTDDFVVRSIKRANTNKWQRA